MKLMNEKLTQLRRQLFQQANSDERKVLKGCRWLLLKNPENLDYGFQARLFLKSWCERAMLTGLAPLMTMAKTLTPLKQGLLSYFDYRISSGPMEGMNNKVKTVQRQSHGMRDQEYFRLPLYSLHETKDAFAG